MYLHGVDKDNSNLITVQQDATYSVYYISVGGSTFTMMGVNTRNM